jgi:hypothetical protein
MLKKLGLQLLLLKLLLLWSSCTVSVSNASNFDGMLLPEMSPCLSESSERSLSNGSSYLPPPSL